MLSCVIKNYDLSLLILSFIDPNYDNFHIHSVIENIRTINNQNYFLFVQTFKCLYRATYLGVDASKVVIKSQCMSYMCSLSMCHWCISMGIESVGKGICDLVCKSNNLVLLQQVVVEYPEWKPTVDQIEFVISNGNLQLLQWMTGYYRYCTLYINNRESCCIAAKCGHLHVLQWLRSQDPPCPWDENTCCTVASCGHLHT